ncbi:hypothetical protein [Frondihabitans sp. PAMC 28766]|uniref:hypothetical protein n=1 Tax=Frondihabitans sp. PAMC 28766 TaxID=1795630 RepID=UPI0012FF917B|nr:hypothetical protein [Frondihabitans sp. PAMC 28766]
MNDPSNRPFSDRDVHDALAQADAQHGAEIAKILDTTSLRLPKPVVTELNRTRKGLKFSKTESLVSLEHDLLLMRIYGSWPRVVRAIDRIMGMPLLPAPPFEPLRMAVHDALWHADRTGDNDLTTRLRRFVEDDDYEPQFLDEDSVLFAHPLDDPHWRLALGLEKRAGAYVLPPAARMDPFLRDLSLLSTIWAYGGSPVWPMDRLEHERARLEAGLLALPGMSKTT